MKLGSESKPTGGHGLIVVPTTGICWIRPATEVGCAEATVTARARAEARAARARAARERLEVSLFSVFFLEGGERSAPEFSSFLDSATAKNVELLMQRIFFQAAQCQPAGASMATLDFKGKKRIDLLHSC